MPKFADDLVAVSVGKDIDYIEESLQESTDQLVHWANKEGMQINTEKKQKSWFLVILPKRLM